VCCGRCARRGAASKLKILLRRSCIPKFIEYTSPTSAQRCRSLRILKISGHYKDYGHSRAAHVSKFEILFHRSFILRAANMHAKCHRRRRSSARAAGFESLETAWRKRLSCADGRREGGTDGHFTSLLSRSFTHR